VELLRKKVESMWVPEAGTMTGYSTMACIQDAGRRAVFGIFWAVAAAKNPRWCRGSSSLIEVIRRSFAAGRNADIIGAYTQLIPGAAATTWTGPSTTPPPEDDLRRGFGGTGTGNGHKAAR